MQIRNYWFGSLSVILAVAYAVMAFNMGPKDTHMDNFLWASMFYIPFFISSFQTFKYSKILVIKKGSWVCLFLLIDSTASMMSIGQNMAGAILGLVNLILCYVLLSHINSERKRATQF